ncbi:MAG: Ig-like domain-containing protein [Bacteroidia bacterium]|nr:Ig-like domain-containing protein [Bacteroidia bacterium]
MKQIVYYFYLFLATQIFISCAIQVAPSGGAQDIVPPGIEKTEPANYSTGFTGNEIAITFDEYIQLKDINSQLLVSPPLKKFPEVKVRKRTLFVQFDDTLEANTTYSFNFGNAIVDNNESNALENYQFVFSTGDVVDSLEISGTVENANDSKTEKDILVMLYKGSDDSLPFKKRPYYFGKTDASGKFRVRNISPGKYKVIGLKDANADYFYNPTEESIAFVDSSVQDGTQDLLLKVFKEESKFKLLKAYAETSGKVVCAFSGAADTLQMKWISDTSSLDIYSKLFSANKDTITIWYKNQQADTMMLSFPQLDGNDTVTIRLLKRDSKTFSRVRQALVISPSTGVGTIQDLHRPFELVFNHPVESAKFDSVHFMEDSVLIRPANFQFSDSLHRRLRYMGNWKAGTSYSVRIPSGQFHDIFQLPNDSLELQFTTRSETDYASLTSVVTTAANRYPMIVQLVDDKDLVFSQQIIYSDTTQTINFLSPGVYKLKFIQDSNKNGRWDSGSYLEHRQPERVYYYPESIQIRANWDVEIKWQLPK